MTHFTTNMTLESLLVLNPVCMFLNPWPLSFQFPSLRSLYTVQTSLFWKSYTYPNVLFFVGKECSSTYSVHFFLHAFLRWSRTVILALYWSTQHFWENPMSHHLSEVPSLFSPSPLREWPYFMIHSPYWCSSGLSLVYPVIGRDGTEESCSFLPST